MSKTTRAVELAARASYGKLLALLAARCQDIALAEDMLADAFAKALKLWPRQGVPENPDAWLFTVARNRLTDHQRHTTRFPTTKEFPDLATQTDHDQTLPDDRLALLMVCAHPALPTDLHTPLMLQSVLGIDAKTIGNLFMVSPAAMTKRLGRAKRKIRDAGIPFNIPDPQSLPTRSTAIMEAIYAVHAHDWLDPIDSLGDEALYLADLLVRLLPEQPEALGLAALIAFGHARCDARIIRGCLIPVEEQDTDLWNKQLLTYGSRLLREAQSLNNPGRFQLEAAIQSVHIARITSSKTDWSALELLYFALIKLTPTTGARVAQTVVTSRLHGNRAGLERLAKIESELTDPFQPLWAARANLLARDGQTKLALVAYQKAISLTTEAPVRRFLEKRKQSLCCN